MVVYYPLEYIAFFSSPFAPIIPSRIVSPTQSAKVQMWSIRAWGIYVVLQVWICANQLGELSWKETASRKVLDGKSEVLEKGEEERERARSDLEMVLKKKKQVWLQLIANASRLPVILHWSVAPLTDSDDNQLTSCDGLGLWFGDSIRMRSVKGFSRLVFMLTRNHT